MRSLFWCSMVVSSYEENIKIRPPGLVGVIGPKRMKHNRVIPRRGNGGGIAGKELEAGPINRHWRRYMSACPIALPSAVGGMGNGRFFAIPSVCFSIPCPALMLESRRRVYCMPDIKNLSKRWTALLLGVLAPSYF